MKTTYERFWEKVSVTPNCWLWTACTNHDGYGLFSLEGRPNLAHRVAYEMEVGSIPSGLQIDHLCRVRNCVNPSHLDPVTTQENTLRGDRGNITHCPQGHEYNIENTYNYRNARQCRSCMKVSNDRSNAKAKARRKAGNKN